MIVPANKCKLANEWLVENVGESARGTFVPRLNTDGKGDKPHTHAVCNWAMSDELFALITNELTRPKYSAEFAEGDYALNDVRGAKETGASFLKKKGLKARRRDAIGG